MKKVFFIYLMFLATCCQAQMTFKNGDKWIPADFNPSKVIILIETFEVSAKAQEKMEDYMAENYPYKYEFATIKEIENKTGKYADLKKYKFAIISSSHNTIWQESGRPGGVQVTGFDYNFVDRETDKSYPPTKRSSSYAIMTFKPMINTIIKKFE